MDEKPLVWTDELIARYWKYIRSQRNLDHLNFSLLLQNTLLKILRKKVYSKIVNKKNISLLDYSCGSGVFLEKVLSNLPIRCAGSEFTTQENIQNLNDKLQKYSNFDKVYNFLEKQQEELSFDIVTCFEVIEHLNDEYLKMFFQKMSAILKEGGYLLLSVPNNEDLSLSTQYCPCCNHTFHTMQHEQSFSQSSLTKILNDNGFEVCEAFEADLIVNERLTLFLRNPIKNFLNLAYLLKPFIRKYKNQQKPNLVIIARYKK